MKKLLFSLLLALTPVLLNAQSQSPPRHALRVGVVLDLDSYHTLKPSMTVDYQYVLSDYFDINLNFHYSNLSYDYKGIIPYDGHYYDPSLRLMFTPFPKWFRYFQFGIGLKFLYGQYTYGAPNLYISPTFEERFYEYTRDTYTRWGFTFPIRMYIINNSKYQLFVDYYTCTTIWNMKKI